jgi:large subunit ribosomal protein L5
MESELYKKYREKAVPALQETFGYGNPHQVPQISKVTVNTCVGSAQDIRAALDEAKKEISMITGQSPIETISRKSISNFKLREGQPIGAKVTLRRQRMYDFLERLINAALPRIRDFRGISPKAFDGRGNYTLGVSDQSIFPEIELDKITKNVGFDITITTTAKTDKEAKLLLSELGMPFSDKTAAAAQQN